MIIFEEVTVIFSPTLANTQRCEFVTRYRNAIQPVVYCFVCFVWLKRIGMLVHHRVTWFVYYEVTRSITTPPWMACLSITGWPGLYTMK